MFFALESTSNLQLIDSVFFVVIGGLAMASPVQGGIGAFHWIVSLGITLFGISREDGLVFATLLHESQMLLVVITGTIGIIMVSIKNRPIPKLNDYKL